ncbi:DoxX family protein [Candidatus Omnitrophota bacterium]
MKKENLLNLSMLILRVMVGVIFVAHGAQKLFGTFDGIGLDGTAKMVEGLGFSNASVIAIIWAGIEFIGGIFLILGILARWSALAIALTMLVRLWKVNLMYGFFIQNGGIEYGLLILGACMPLILMGGGSWSVWDV